MKQKHPHPQRGPAPAACQPLRQSARELPCHAVPRRERNDPGKSPGIQAAAEETRTRTVNLSPGHARPATAPGQPFPAAGNGAINGVTASLARAIAAYYLSLAAGWVRSVSGGSHSHPESERTVPAVASSALASHAFTQPRRLRLRLPPELAGGGESPLLEGTGTGRPGRRPIEWFR